MVEAVIFDMDGLMIDSEVVSFAVYKSLLLEHGVELDKELYCYCFAGKTMVNGLKFAKEYFHLNYDIEEACQYCDRMEHFIVERDGVALKSGLLELLEYLKRNNIKIGMATSSGLERIYKLIGRYDILKYFNDITYGSEVKNGKPAPDIFLKACDKLKVEYDHALVLEDSEAGIQAGYKANIPTICIPDMKYPEDKYVSMTTRILSNLKDVIDYIEGEKI